MSDRIAWVPYESVDEAERVLGAHPGIRYEPFTDNSTPPGDIDRVGFLVLPYAQQPEILDRIGEMGSLEVVQSQMAGVDAIASKVPAEVALCNAAGVHDSATAEIALALALAKARDLDLYARDQPAGVWKPHWAPGLADQRVTVIGYGHIGKAIERRLAGFEVASITRLATTARTESVDGEDVEVRAIDELMEALPETDVLFIIAPLTDTTRGLIDEKALAALPDGAMVVNVGRGPIVDTEALIQACQGGRITAAMDVIDPEPVPPLHPLRTTPGVLFSPHVGGYTRAFEPRRDALLRRQLEHWAKGESLDNVVEGRG